MTKPFIVAAVQMNCVMGDINENLRVAKKMILEAADKGAALVVLPELFDTGYRVEEKDREVATSIPGKTTDFLEAICKERNIHVVGAIIEKIDNELFDTAVLVGPSGVVGKYRKTALWAAENNRFSKGTHEYQVFDIGFCKIGLLICYEIGFPEAARVLTLQGADILLYPSAFGKSRYYAWDIASRARALENGNYVIACNRTGIEKSETEFGGGSRIIAPKGNVLVQAAEEFEVIVAEVDLELIREQRDVIPYLKDLNCKRFAQYYERH